MSCLDSFLSPASLWAQSDPSCLTGHFPQCQELRSTLSKRWEQHYFPTPCLSLQPWLRRKACLSITHAPFITETTLSKDCSCLTSKDCGFLPTCIFGGCLHIMTAQITPVCWHLFLFFFSAGSQTGHCSSETKLQTPSRWKPTISFAPVKLVEAHQEKSPLRANNV